MQEKYCPSPDRKAQEQGKPNQLPGIRRAKTLPERRLQNREQSPRKFFYGRIETLPTAGWVLYIWRVLQGKADIRHGEMFGR